jgi:hypothetical protein
MELLESIAVSTSSMCRSTAHRPVTATIRARRMMFAVMQPLQAQVEGPLARWR